MWGMCVSLYILKTLENCSAALSQEVCHWLALVGSLLVGAGPLSVRNGGQISTLEVTAIPNVALCSPKLITIIVCVLRAPNRTTLPAPKNPSLMGIMTGFIFIV